jgi:hypothetical protein
VLSDAPMDEYDRHINRIQAAEDDARNNLGTLSSVLAIQVEPNEFVWMLVLAWISLGLATHLSAIHSIALTRWVRQGSEDPSVRKNVINLLNLTLLGLGLTALLGVAILNL